MTTPISIEPHPTLRNENEYPFCPGCGHGSVLDSLNEAMVRLELKPHEVVIVSDIGCSGLSDQYFTTSAFHGLHGRSITYASGIKLAQPELNVLALLVARHPQCLRCAALVLAHHLVARDVRSRQVPLNAAEVLDQHLGSLDGLASLIDDSAAHDCSALSRDARSRQTNNCGAGHHSLHSSLSRVLGFSHACWAC